MLPLVSSVERIRVASPPSRVSALAPGPWMSSASLIAISLPTGIVPVRPLAKLIVPASAAAFAWVIASRRLPGPLSLVFVTVNVAASALDAPSATAAPTAAVAATEARRQRRLARCSSRACALTIARFDT